ncbi:hypothetical protein CBS101457_005011 [Exobasidium rhododendri]|nr:hypothetical protein CBS101457_005011 [Exobasidium rhododendri]
MSMLKQIAVVRRRAGLSRKEFFDYHFQVHGALSSGPVEAETPLIYYQTHFFDSIYFPRDAATPPPASNFAPGWGGHDDMTELYFSDAAHLDAVFGSKYVKTVVGPDSLNFNDFSAVIPIFVSERKVALPWQDSAADPGANDAESFNANIFLTAKKIESAANLTEKLVEILSATNKEQILAIVENIRRKPDSKIDLDKYFGRFPGTPAPNLVLQVKIASRAHFTEFVAALRAFLGQINDDVDLGESFITFGLRALILDVANGQKMDASRQPRLFSN